MLSHLRQRSPLQNQFDKDGGREIMKTTEQIQDDIFNIIEECNENNGQYSVDSTDKAKAAALITEYIIHNILN